MASHKYEAAARTNVIDKNASLANDVRAAGDYDNSSGGYLEAIAYLTVQYDTTAPSAADIVAELWVLPGDGAGTEAFPNGGDGTVGNNFRPQGSLMVGTFQCVNPSTSVDEELALPVPLYPNGNRFVLQNLSGQTYDLTWDLDIVPIRRQVVP